MMAASRSPPWTNAPLFIRITHIGTIVLLSDILHRSLISPRPAAFPGCHARQRYTRPTHLKPVLLVIIRLYACHRTTVRYPAACSISLLTPTYMYDFAPHPPGATLQLAYPPSTAMDHTVAYAYLLFFKFPLSFMCFVSTERPLPTRFVVPDRTITEVDRPHGSNLTSGFFLRSRCRSSHYHRIYMFMSSIPFDTSAFIVITLVYSISKSALLLGFFFL